MEQKTKIDAVEGKQDLTITREFDLPVELLFQAYTEADLVEQWMGTKVLKLESRPHGGYQFETSDPKGNMMFRASGVIHEFSPDRKITRTFEMEKAPFGVQLEVLEFEPLGGETEDVWSWFAFGDLLAGDHGVERARQPDRHEQGVDRRSRRG